MSFRLSIAALVLLVFTTGRGGEATEAAPLDASKKELQALSKQPALPEVSSSQLRLGLPQVQGPTIDSSQLGLPKQQKPNTLSDPKKDRKKNWLLDGVDQLEKETKFKTTGKRSGTDELEDSKEDELDPNDSDYLLQAYTRQQEKNDEKTAAARPAIARVDPMAPFLQNWLSDSPVRGKFFDDYSNQRGASARETGETTAGLPRESTIQNFSTVDGLNRSRSEAVREATRPNPYLQEIPVARSVPVAESLSLLSLLPGIPASQTNPIGRESASSVLSPIEPVRKPQFPVQSDEQKYFPQLKKF